MSDRRQAKATEHPVAGKWLIQYHVRLGVTGHAGLMHHKGKVYHWVRSGGTQDYNGEFEYRVYGENPGVLLFSASLFLQLAHQTDQSSLEILQNLAV